MKCVYCQQMIRRNLTIGELLVPFTIKEERCYKCEQLFERIQGDVCPTCMNYHQQSDEQCLECQRWKSLYPEYIFKHRALFQYNEGLKEWMYQYKFLGDYRLAKTFKQELQGVLKKEKKKIICPIPLSPERQKKRGFNQVTALLDAADIPYQELLRKSIHTQAQSHKTRQERLEMAQPFQLIGSRTGSLQNQAILLVDDVYTTGRTLFHAAACFFDQGVKEIQTFSLAR